MEIINGKSIGASIDDYYLINHAINEIYSTYGERASVESKKKSLIKFGRNELVSDAGSTLMTLPAGIDNETYVSDNTIAYFSSSNAGDTQDIKVEGHTLSGSDLTFSVQSVTLAGQTKTALTTPLARITRAYNDDSTDFAGVIYFYEDDTLTAGVPQTDAKVHMMIPVGTNQTEKAATSISSTDYWIITGFYCSVLNKTAAFVDVQIQIREIGKVFRTRANLGAASPGNVSKLEFEPALIAPSNSDIRLVATASTNGIDVSGGIEGYLAIAN